MDSPAIITHGDSSDYAVVRLEKIAGDNFIVVSFDQTLVAEAFDRIGDATRELAGQLNRLGDSFAEMCVRALRQEEVCYESHPVEPECRHHTVSEMGCNAGLALPALNRRDIMHSERW